jgi:hypothetical protein
MMLLKIRKAGVFGQVENSVGFCVKSSIQ